MSKSKGNSLKLLSRTGLTLSGLVVLAASTLMVGTVSAQSVLVKLDKNEIEVGKALRASDDSNNGVVKKTLRKQATISANTKSDRDEEGSSKKLFPRIAIGKGDREEEGSQTSTKQIVIGKGEEAEENERPVKRQVIVEAKPKKKIVAAKKKVQQVVLAKAEEPAKKVVIADAEPVEEAAPAAEDEVETPAAEEQTTETPAEPKKTFEVGQIVTGGDGNSYVIVSIDETGVSVMPLSAFAEYQPVKKVYKKKRYKKRYSSYGNYGSYGGSSCH